MKKTWLVFIFILLLSLSACGGGDAADASESTSDASVAADASSASDISSGAENEESSSAEASGTQESDVSSTGEESAPSQEQSGAPDTNEEASTETQPPVENNITVSGIFTCYDNNRFSAERAPQITLMPDGTFMFRINLGDERLGAVSGTFKQNGSTLEMAITSKNSSDYLGEDLDSLTFVLESGNILSYKGERIGLTLSNNKFKHDGDANGFDPVKPAAPESSGSSTAPQSGSEEGEAVPGAIEGTFICYNPYRYDDDRAPTLVFSADGSYTFTCNLGDERMGIVTGTYKVDGTKLNLTVNSRDSKDYLGDSINPIRFEITDKNTIIYKSDRMGMTFRGNIFRLNGIRPTPSDAIESMPNP